MLFAMMGMNLLQLKPLIKPFVVGMGSELIPLLTKNLEPSKMLDIGFLREEVDNLMTEKLEELTPERVKTLIEDVIRDHLGWCVILFVFLWSPHSLVSYFILAKVDCLGKHIRRACWHR